MASLTRKEGAGSAGQKVGIPSRFGRSAPIAGVFGRWRRRRFLVQLRTPRGWHYGSHPRCKEAMGGRVLVGVESDLELGVEARFTFDDDAPHTVDASRTTFRPIRRHVAAHPVDMFDGDGFLPADHTDASNDIDRPSPGSITPEAVSSRRGAGAN